MSIGTVISFTRKKSRREISSLATDFCYPFTVEKQGKESFLIQFPHVPEALTEGASKEEAVSLAQDCLIAALGFYVKAWRPLPLPHISKNNEYVVNLPAIILAKLHLIKEMQEQNVSISQLAKRLRLTKQHVQDLVNLDKPAMFLFIEDAFSALNKRLIISISDLK